MTGTGTANDPFLVDNLADFRTIDTSSGVYVRWADSENKIIDFNDIQPEGFSETVNFPANVDFNGWTLRNFHSTASPAIKFPPSDSSVENLIFENFYIMSTDVFNGAVTFEKCRFSGMIPSSSGCTVFHGGGLQNSSLNLKVNATSCSIFAGSGFLSPKTQITNSDIILDISCTGTVSVCDRMIKNSRFSGKIQCGGTSVTLGNSSGMFNVFSLESDKPLNYSSSAISVFNSDISEKYSGSNKSFTGVTSEELKNAEYLYNIGFPIGI